MNKPMSKAARKYHIKTSGMDKCPYCKVDLYDNDMNEALEYKEVDFVEDGDIHQEAKCTKCNRRWMDVFRLVEVRELFSE